jgi:NAD(P)-dependent dehydrogenase (short-subunit alcohol dehydrogenase family)
MGMSLFADPVVLAPYLRKAVAMKGLVDGKVALVTGGGSGIGRSICELLAEHGAAVAVIDISKDGGEQTVGNITGKGGKAAFYQCDLADPASIAAVCADVISNNGRIDVLVNNCGIGCSKTVTDMEEEEWRRVLNINLDAMFRFCKLAVRDMLKRKTGSVVNISSLGGILGGPDGVAYCTSKFGVIGLTRSMAADHGKDGIRINSVAPGFTFTPMAEAGFANADDPAKARAKFERCIPVGRMAEPREIAAGVLFLASDLASYCSGAVLPVDGGVTGCFWPQGM